MTDTFIEIGKGYKSQKHGFQGEISFIFLQRITMKNYFKQVKAEKKLW